MCEFLSGWQSGACHFGSLWSWHWLLTSFLWFSYLKHISFIKNNFPPLCLMPDQFLMGIRQVTVCFSYFFCKSIIIRYWRYPSQKMTSVLMTQLHWIMTVLIQPHFVWSLGELSFWKEYPPPHLTRLPVQVNSYGHCGTVSSPNHTFSLAGLNKRLTSNSCTYFRL